MDGIYRNNKDRISGLLTKVKDVPHQIGCLFIDGNRAKGMELFASNILFKKYFKKVISGYLLDQLGNLLENPKTLNDYAKSRYQLRKIVQHYNGIIQSIRRQPFSPIEHDEITSEEDFDYVIKQFRQTEDILKGMQDEILYYLNSLRKTWKHVGKLRGMQEEFGNQQSIGNEVELATKFIEKIKDFSYEKYEGVGQLEFTGSKR